MKYFILWGTAFVLVASFSVGCGPVQSTHLILKSDTALHNAGTAQADNKSPYEYTAAQQYLHKAREKWGTSDFEYAIDYAKEALKMAIKARERALKGDED